VMKRARVKFGDVRPNNDIGYLAIASVDAGDGVVRPRKGRLYD